MALRSRGIELRIGDGGSPESFTKIAEILDVNGIDAGETQFENITNHDTPVGTQERLAIAVEEGQLRLGLHWDPEDPVQDHASGIEFDRRQLNRRNYQMVIPNVTTNNLRTFAAFVQSFEKSGPVTGVLNATLVLQRDGQTTVSTE